MNYEDLMQWKGYLFLDNIVEPGTNSLRVSISRASVSAESEDISFEEYTINDV
ncbi:hypothetical protein [Lysinibacillus sp. YS11]|nr:hypothetical protein [Lysinibacillus sp. YS11]